MSSSPIVTASPISISSVNMDDGSPDADPLAPRSSLLEQVDDYRGLLGQDPDVIKDVCRVGRPLDSEIRYMSPHFPDFLLRQLKGAGIKCALVSNNSRETDRVL